MPDLRMHAYSRAEKTERATEKEIEDMGGFSHALEKRKT
jgi:hypothetical protein